VYDKKHIRRLSGREAFVSGESVDVGERHQIVIKSSKNGALHRPFFGVVCCEVSIRYSVNINTFHWNLERALRNPLNCRRNKLARCPSIKYQVKSVIWIIVNSIGKTVISTGKRESRLPHSVMNADGSGQTQLTNNDADDEEPNWQPIRRPVGGVVAPMNKLALLAPYLALLGFVGAVTAAVVMKRRLKAQTSSSLFFETSYHPCERREH